MRTIIEALVNYENKFFVDLSIPIKEEVKIKKIVSFIKSELIEFGFKGPFTSKEDIELFLKSKDIKIERTYDGMYEYFSICSLKENKGTTLNIRY